jgi:uncharacterized membrane protein
MADGIARATRGELAAHQGDVPVSRSVTIDRPREELYAFWRNFNNLPLFMRNIHSVAVSDSARSHWVVSAPAGETVEWNSEVIADDPNRLIAWRSLAGAGVCNSGRVEFRDSADRSGTGVTVTKEPQSQAQHIMDSFKKIMETREVYNAQAPAAAPHA